MPPKKATNKSKRHLQIQARMVVCHVYDFMKKEALEKYAEKLTDARWRTSQAVGVSESTISKILREKRQGKYSQEEAAGNFELVLMEDSTAAVKTETDWIKTETKCLMNPELAAAPDIKIEPDRPNSTSAIKSEPVDYIEDSERFYDSKTAVKLEKPECESPSLLVETSRVLSSDSEDNL